MGNSSQCSARSLGQFAPALGMTREEVEGYGLRWQEELFTEPFITDWVLDRIFREHTNEVRDKYIEKHGVIATKCVQNTIHNAK